MDACESAELRHLRKVCEVQRDYIDCKINKEIYQRQIDDANCTYKFYLQEEIEKLKLEKDQIDMVIANYSLTIFLDACYILNMIENITKAI